MKQLNCNLAPTAEIFNKKNLFGQPNSLCNIWGIVRKTQQNQICEITTAELKSIKMN